MKPILYLHGAGATPLSFRYIQAMLPSHMSITVQMSPHEPVSKAVTESVAKLEDCGATQDVAIISHSLGGIVGVGLLGLPSVTKLVSLSTPFGGHPMAFLMSMWGPMFRDLSPLGSTIRQMQSKWDAAAKPHLAIVTAKGLPFMGIGEANDGVVTIGSQMVLKGPRYETYPDLNHFEVLLSDTIVDSIRNFVWN